LKIKVISSTIFGKEAAKYASLSNWLEKSELHCMNLKRNVRRLQIYMYEVILLSKLKT